MDPNLEKSVEIKKNILIDDRKEQEDQRLSLSLDNNNILQEKRKDDKLIGEVKKEVSGKKIKTKPLSAKQKLIRREAATKDYRALGISFDLKGVSINDADSSKMAALKEALSFYLQTKKDILDAEKKKSDEELKAMEKSNEIKLIYNEALGSYSSRQIAYKQAAQRASGLGEDHENELRAAYERVQKALVDYTAGKCIWFKWGRGRARLKQVKAVADMLQADNRKYGLSELRAELNASMDYKLHDPSYGVIPTYLGAVRNKDYIDRRHEKLRREGRNNSLHLGWYGALIKDVGNWGLAAYHAAGGTAFRMAAIPTMIAANALELTGKVAKLAMKGVAETVNGIFKLFRSKKRWRIRVDRHTLSHGWTSLNRARKINFLALKHAVAVPLMTVKTSVHSLCRILRNTMREDIDKKSVKGLWKRDFLFLTDNTSALAEREKSIIKSFFGTTKDLQGMAAAELEEIERDKREGNIRDDDDDDNNDDE